MTELEQQFSEAVENTEKAQASGDVDGWLHWGRTKQILLNKLQMQRQQEKYPVNQFERMPDEGLL